MEENNDNNYVVVVDCYKVLELNGSKVGHTFQIVGCAKGLRGKELSY